MKTIHTDSLTIGHVCDCGVTHKWPGYVFAHYDIELVHTCSACGARAIILSGRVTRRDE